MAGVYGSLNSRDDFFTTLHTAIPDVSGHLQQTPGDETLSSILRQLQAIDGWTKNGRAPTRVERKSVDFALRATREYEGNSSMYQLTRRLYELDSYFSDWPNDERAASATDDDFFDSDED